LKEALSPTPVQEDVERRAEDSVESDCEIEMLGGEPWEDQRRRTAW